MKLYKKIASLLAVAALAAVLMPVCMAAPGDSIETRLNNAFALRASTEFYEEVVTTSPDGTTQTMTAARSNGNAYIKMDMGEAGQLVYILKDGQGYLVDAASKLAVRGEVPTVTVSEEAASGEAQAIPCTETTMNVNGQDCEALSYTVTGDDGQTSTVSYCLVGDDLKYVVTDAAEGPEPLQHPCGLSDHDAGGAGRTDGPVRAFQMRHGSCFGSSFLLSAAPECAIL